MDVAATADRFVQALLHDERLHSNLIAGGGLLVAIGVGCYGLGVLNFGRQEA